jgi:hypothetical protein
LSNFDCFSSSQIDNLFSSPMTAAANNLFGERDSPAKFALSALRGDDHRLTTTTIHQD